MTFGTPQRASWLTKVSTSCKCRSGLGHSSYVLTLTTYAADCVPEQETENPLPEPVAPTTPATNVVNLFG